ILYYHPFQTKFTPLRIHAKDSPTKEYISIFNFLRDGNKLWLATQHGFARYSLSKKTYQLYLTGRVGYSLAKDSQGTLWASGYEQGLYRYNSSSDQFESI